MIGGILAIVYSLLLFAIQSAANQYSSSFYSLYLPKERGGRTFAIIVVITIAFFASGIYFGKFPDYVPLDQNLGKTVIYLSLILIGLVFVLVDYYYQTVKKVLDPIHALRGATITASRLIAGMKKDAALTSKILFAQNQGKVGQDYALAASYIHFVKPHLRQIDTILENLFGVAGKLVERHEVSAANSYLRAIGGLLVAYLHIRKDSSLRLPSDETIFAQVSDSQNFIGSSLERFNTWANVFIRANKVENAVTIVNILTQLAVASKDITFVGSRTNDNPILEQILGYRRMLIKDAIKLKAGDVVLNSANSLSELTTLLIEKNYHVTLHGLFDEIFDVAIFGLVSKATYITERCTDALVATIDAVFKYQYWKPEHVLSTALDKLKNITEAQHFYTLSLDYSSRFASYSALLKPYQSLPVVLQKYTHEFLGKEQIDPNDQFVTTLLQFSEDLYQMLRKMAEELKDADADFFDPAGELVYFENVFLLDARKKVSNDPSYASVITEIDRRVGFNIFLPYWFLRHSKELSNDLHYTGFTDPIGKFALLSIEADRWDFVEDCTRAFWDIVKLALERAKGGYGYAEPRIMEELCYLGILAQKHGQNVVLEKIRANIGEFEGLYKKKYFTNLPQGLVTSSPTEEQLQAELLSFSSDLLRSRSVTALRDSFKDEVVQKINYKDVDKFIEYVWNAVPSAAPAPKATAPSTIQPPQ